MSKLTFNPSKVDLASWNQPKHQQQQQQHDYAMSKDGIQNLKARFYAPPGGHSQPQLPPHLQQQQQQQQPQKTRLVSQENYLFNSKNAATVVSRQYSADQNENDYENASYNNYNSPSPFSGYNDQIASSDL
jgi:hypothetical protein